MIVIRCTQRLAKRFHLRLTDGAPEPTGLLGDWYANLLNVGHSRLVLCLSERTLLPVLLPARQREFPSRFPTYLAPVLEYLGIPQGLIQTEANVASEVAFSRTRSRQVLGALNDFAFNASVHLAHGASPLQVSLKLTEMPSKPIHYDSPGRVTQSLFATQGRG
jgi:hypothetical protein